MLTTHPKLANITLGKVIVFADYDLTLAEKDQKDFDKAPLTSEQYAGLVNMASKILRFVIVTASGEERILGYLGEHLAQHGRLPNTSLGSNSGHLWHKLDFGHKDQKWNVIPVPGYTTTELNQTVANIDSALDAIHAKFPSVQIDRRELCGAVIYNFPGDADSTEHLAFQAFCDSLRGSDIEYSKKHRPTMNDGKISTQGYIDLKPKNMDKGLTTADLLAHYSHNEKEPFVIVAGDSEPDYAMMKAVAKTTPPERRLFISVGKGLAKIDAEYEKEHGHKLIDVTLAGNGLSPVQQLHALLENIITQNAQPVTHLEPTRSAKHPADHGYRGLQHLTNDQ